MLQGSHVVLNGELLRREAARIAVDDRGFLVGDGVFETLRVYDGAPFLIDEHLERLDASLAFVDISVPWRHDDLLAQIRMLLQANDLRAGSARLRLTVSRGAVAPRGAGAPTLLLSADPYEAPDPRHYERGVEVAISRHVRHPAPWHGIKSTSCQPNLMLRREAESQGAFEVLQWNDAGRLTEGSFTNVFVVDADSVLCTPLPEEGCLRGITRHAVLGLAARAGMPARQGDIDDVCLENAREVFLTGSLVEIVPVRSIGGRALGGSADWRAAGGDPGQRAAGRPCPGCVTLALRQAYGALVGRR